jgi:non-specific serine/threonine protein kinase
MNFVNPGLLGGIQHFKTQYANAIDKNHDENGAKELKNLIDPFLMRRTKEQVATDLPQKTEQIIYCEMGKEQRKVYEAFKNEYRDKLLGMIEEDGIGKSQMHILEGLTKLRQICDSPSLLSDDEEYTNESVKIDRLVEDVTEKTGNHKILIFSQFTSMLSLIKTRLEKEGIVYEYLDGATRNRQEKVDNFQENDEVRVFLISLKAGGTGLNLTAAEYVYIVDPWWNPAIEDQASDRVHRIGQQRPVTIYRLIAENTIEEKIVKMHHEKRSLADKLLADTDQSAKISSEELMALITEQV